MLKRISLCFLLAGLLCLSPASAFATGQSIGINSSTSASTDSGISIAPSFASITLITFVFSLSGNNVDLSVFVIPKPSAGVDSVTVSADLYKVGSSTPVKSWKAARLYADELGQFNFMESYKLTSRGTYYFKATIKTFKGNTLIETFQGESVQKVY